MDGKNQQKINRFLHRNLPTNLDLSAYHRSIHFIYSIIGNILPHPSSIPNYMFNDNFLIIK